jgi:SAM-dependent methyltransferase
MPTPDTDRLFAGSIPQLYEQYLVPLIFEPCAVDLAARVALCRPASVLEIAAGTGVVTRHLARTLPAGTRITATDLNPPMLEQARMAGTAQPVEWRQADAMQLPFDNAMFDAVVCQCGVMFFPDKPRAFAEALRVLRPGGALLFNVWDRIEDNEFPDTVTQALAGMFPDDPPRFLARVPHGYHDPAKVREDLARGGFTQDVQVATLTARSRAASPRIPAIAFCHGTPLRNEIEARDRERLEDATDVAAEAIARRFGAGRVEGKIQALVFSVVR